MEFPGLWGISNVLNGLRIKNELGFVTVIQMDSRINFTVEMGFRWFGFLRESGAIFGMRWDRTKLNQKMRMKWERNEEGSFRWMY